MADPGMIFIINICLMGIFKIAYSPFYTGLVPLLRPRYFSLHINKSSFRKNLPQFTGISGGPPVTNNGRSSSKRVWCNVSEYNMCGKKLKNKKKQSMFCIWSRHTYRRPADVFFFFNPLSYLYEK